MENYMPRITRNDWKYAKAHRTVLIFVLNRHMRFDGVFYRITTLVIPLCLRRRTDTDFAQGDFVIVLE